MGRPPSSGGTRPSGSIRTKGGWRCGCPPRWLTCRIRRGGRRPTGCRVWWASATARPSGRRRPEAAQAGTSAVRYDLAFDPDKRRWYADCSWQQPRRVPPSLAALRGQPSFGVDLNADHLAGWGLDPSGNPIGDLATIPLHLDGLPATIRDGRLRAAVATVIQLATRAGCQSIVVEDLDFADARQLGRGRLGSGRRGRRFRRAVHGIPTRAVRDLLVGMAAIRGCCVVAV